MMVRMETDDGAGTATEPSTSPLDDRTDESAGEPARLGRKRDHSRDPEILAAALDVLAETGYEGMTVDMVATRAKAGKATLYRRWPSKAELVLDAVACMKRDMLDPENLPDTGTLRGDLVALIRPPSIAEGERKLQIVAGLISMSSRSPELAAAVRAAFVEPRAAANRIILQRAIDRGEIPASVDVATMSMLVPSMASYRLLLEHGVVDRDYLVGVIDGILLPAVGLAGTRI